MKANIMRGNFKVSLKNYRIAFYYVRGTILIANRAFQNRGQNR